MAWSRLASGSTIIGSLPPGSSTEYLRHRDLLVGEDLLAGTGDPVQRVDRGQDLHRKGLVAGLALLAHDQVADVVALIDHDLRGALEVERPVAERQLGPERLDLGH